MMKILPWFRMYSEIINDELIELISFEDQRHYVWLLCLKNQGILDKKYNSDEIRDRILAKKLGLDLEKLKDVKARLLDIGLIKNDWNPKGWDKRQFVSDTSTARVKRFRERQKINELESGNDDETFHGRYSNDDVTAPDTETDTDTDKNKAAKSKKEKLKRIAEKFDLFWVAYPKKTAKKTALKSFMKIGPDDDLFKKIMDGLSGAKKSDQWKKDSGQFIPMATTWLNQERWEDEFDIKPSGGNHQSHKLYRAPSKPVQVADPEAAKKALQLAKQSLRTMP